jgi:hypothetical protein
MSSRASQGFAIAGEGRHRARHRRGTGAAIAPIVAMGARCGRRAQPCGPHQSVASRRGARQEILDQSTTPQPSRSWTFSIRCVLFMFLMRSWYRRIHKSSALKDAGVPERRRARLAASCRSSHSSASSWDIVLIEIGCNFTQDATIPCGASRPTWSGDEWGRSRLTGVGLL